MAMRVLIVPDKFKGTLTANQVAEAIAEGWKQARPADSIELFPMTDGGDGFGTLLSQRLQAESRLVRTVDAAGQPCDAEWWWAAGRRVAIVEAAQANGLARLPKGRWHPFDLDTSGLAPLLRAAESAGAEKCLVGIGGSATNDGGFGMARALGWKFWDAAGQPILQWTQLERLERVERPASPLRIPDLKVAVDVSNPLLGPQGCSRIYGPQKGLKPEDMPRAEAPLAALAAVIERQLGLNHAEAPGAGAAGGLGFGLATFAGATLTPGFGLFAEISGLEERIRQSDLILTGEGCMDPSSLMGKGVGGVASLCRNFGKPCVGLGGSRVDTALLAKHLTSSYALVPDLVSLDEALAQPFVHLQTLARKVAEMWPQRWNP